MLASVELKKRENRDDLGILQMNGYVPCGIYSIQVYFFYQKQVPVCERTFSIQNQILTTKRNRLSPEISDKLTRVKIHGKGLKEENFQGILEKWRKNKFRKLKSKT